MSVSVNEHGVALEVQPIGQPALLLNALTELFGRDVTKAIMDYLHLTACYVFLPRPKELDEVSDDIKAQIREFFGPHAI